LSPVTASSGGSRNASWWSRTTFLGAGPLEVDFGWFDHLLYTNDRENMPPAFSPRAATPAFVASAIDFALKSGWNADQRGGRFLVKYSSEVGFHWSPDGALPNSRPEADRKGN
jgi:hypothetical protein